MIRLNADNPTFTCALTIAVGSQASTRQTFLTDYLISIRLALAAVGKELSDLPRQFLQRRPAQCEASARSPALRAHPPRRDVPDLSGGRSDLQSRLSCFTIHYQRDPVQTTKTSVHGADQHTGPREAARQKSCRPRRRKFMAIRTCTRKPRITGVTSIRSACARATMKASAARKLCSWIIGGSKNCESRSLVFSLATAVHPHDGCSSCWLT